MRIDPNTGSVTLGRWPLGEVNTSSDVSVPNDGLRLAVNVNLSADGVPSRRKGIRQLIAMAGAHSLYTDGARMYWGGPAGLYMADSTGKPTLLDVSTAYAAPLAFVTVNGDTYVTNDAIGTKITAAGVAEPWGIVPPAAAPVPVAAPLVGGELGIRMQVTCTFVTATGEESGAPLAAEVIVGSNPSFQIIGIPQSADPRVVATRIYATNVDGQDFYRVADAPNGTLTMAVSGFGGAGMALTTQFNGPPPTGHILEYYAGRILIASGSVLHYTEALRYSLYDNVHNFIQFPARITMVKAVPDGVFVSADRVYFLPALGTDDVSQRVVSLHKAIEGAACNDLGTSDVFWFSERGLMRGSSGGKVEEVTGGRLAMPYYPQGRATMVLSAGSPQVVGVFDYGVPSARTHADFLAEEARRANTVL